MVKLSLKDKSAIESILLEFEYDVYEYSVFDGFKIDLTFKPNLVGFDKLKVVDDIITRFRRTKYNKIFIENNLMCIGESESKNNVNGSLVEEVKKLLNDKLGGLKEFQSKYYTHLTLYGKDRNNIVLNYDHEIKKLYVSHTNIWLFFVCDYMLQYDDIQYIIQQYVVNEYKIEVLDTYASF